MEPTSDQRGTPGACPFLGLVVWRGERTAVRKVGGFIKAMRLSALDPLGRGRGGRSANARPAAAEFTMRGMTGRTVDFAIERVDVDDLMQRSTWWCSLVAIPPAGKFGRSGPAS
jgi:hypothetical protein